MPPWVTPLVLAMLVLRSLIPAGFMLAPVNGGLAVVLCDADATASLYRHAGHNMPGMGSGDDVAGAHSGDDMAGMASGDDIAVMGDMSATDMAGHEMPGPGHTGHTHPDPTCPYAQSSGATPLPFLATVTSALVPGAPVLPDLIAQIHAHFGPTRQQSPRGPPKLS